MANADTWLDYWHETIAAAGLTGMPLQLAMQCYVLDDTERLLSLWLPIDYWPLRVDAIERRMAATLQSYTGRSVAISCGNSNVVTLYAVPWRHGEVELR